MRIGPIGIALYEPDIPQNTGTILRLAACLGCRSPHHRAGRLPGLRPRTPPRRNGLSRPGEPSATRELLAEFAAWRGKPAYRLILFTTEGHTCYLDHRLPRKRPAAVRPRVRRGAGGGAPRRARAARHPDAAGTCVPSTWRWRLRWRSGKPCGRPAAFRRASLRPDPLEETEDIAQIRAGLGARRAHVGLRGQGDLPHPAGRGRPGRPRGGVLPLRRLQPMERAGARPRRRRLHLLRHRLRRDRRAGRRQVPHRRRSRRCRRGRLGGTAGQPAGGADRRRAALAARRGAGVRLARSGLLDRAGDQRHDSPRRPASTGSASARRPTRRWRS